MMMPKESMSSRTVMRMKTTAAGRGAEAGDLSLIPAHPIRPARRMVEKRRALSSFPDVPAPQLFTPELCQKTEASVLWQNASKEIHNEIPFRGSFLESPLQWLLL